MVGDLTTRYDFYRKIRGDGNCYYRAVYVNYLEHLIVFEKEPALCVLDLIIDIYDRKEFFFYEINSKFDLIYSRYVVGYLLQIHEALRGWGVVKSANLNDDFQRRKDALVLFYQMVLLENEFDRVSSLSYLGLYCSVTHHGG